MARAGAPREHCARFRRRAVRRACEFIFFHMIDINEAQARPGVELWRRLAAIVYDLVPLAGVLFLAGGLAVAVHGGEAIAPRSPWFTLYLIACVYAYFGYSWHRGGQTLGMRAWKIVLLDDRTGGPPSWSQTLIRFLAAALSWAPCGLGFLWALVDPERRAWHDRLSRSRLVRRPK